MNVKLVWATPDADKVVGYCARVSNPDNQDNPEVGGLIRYCARNAHWSIFEMANVCLEVETTRDIGRQLLRHRSLHFQEFSGRYQSYDKLEAPSFREARMQDTKNRQNSLPCDDPAVISWWDNAQREQLTESLSLYNRALELGIAKEQARALLPEGLTPSRLYVNGTLRSWIHWLQVRSDPSTQKEHRELAAEALTVLRGVAPITFGALFAE